MIKETVPLQHVRDDDIIIGFTMPTEDYNPATDRGKYKWDPELKKTVYVKQGGAKKTIEKQASAKWEGFNGHYELDVKGQGGGVIEDETNSKEGQYGRVKTWSATPWDKDYKSGEKKYFSTKEAAKEYAKSLMSSRQENQLKSDINELKALAEQKNYGKEAYERDKALIEVDTNPNIKRNWEETAYDKKYKEERLARAKKNVEKFAPLYENKESQPKAEKTSENKSSEELLSELKKAEHKEREIMRKHWSGELSDDEYHKAMRETDTIGKRHTYIEAKNNEKKDEKRLEAINKMLKKNAKDKYIENKLLNKAQTMQNGVKAAMNGWQIYFTNADIPANPKGEGINMERITEPLNEDIHPFYEVEIDMNDIEKVIALQKAKKYTALGAPIYRNGEMVGLANPQRLKEIINTMSGNYKIYQRTPKSPILFVKGKKLEEAGNALVTSINPGDDLKNTKSTLHYNLKEAGIDLKKKKEKWDEDNILPFN